MRLVADQHIPYLRGVLDPFFQDIVYLPADKIDASALKNADALIIRTRTFCNRNLLEGSSVKFIGSATVGYDHIDTHYCDEHGIKWVNSPGCNSNAVLQWVVSALIHFSDENDNPLKDKVLGVVGVGNVGSKVAKAGEALGMRVLCCDPPRKRKEGLTHFTDFETIARESDFITFHVPLTKTGEDATWHMVGSSFFKKVKPTAIIFNSSRGEVIETMSLIHAIQYKRVKTVALDVWENEPRISHELVNLVDIATPHIAGYSLEGKVNGTKMVIDELSKFFKLSLHPWLPKDNPLVKQGVIDHPVNIRDVLINAYSIDTDSLALKKNPEQFEEFRSNYTYRRDYSAYEVVTNNSSFGKILSSIGFQVNSR